MKMHDSEARPTDVESGFNNVESSETGPPPDLSKSILSSKTRSKKLLLISLCLVLVVSVGGVLLWINKHKTPKTVPLTKVSVRLGWLNQAQFAGMDVALDKGYYRQAGLDVELKEYQDGGDANSEVDQGKSDFGVSTPMEIIINIDKGAKIKALAAIYQTSAYAIVSPVSANIKSPADLKGKVLGNVGNNAEATVTYPALMSSYGLNVSSATIKKIDFDIVKEFQDKTADTADIYRTDQTYLLEQAGIKYNLLLPENFGFNIYGDTLITSTKLINQNPKLVAGFVEATLRGWKYAVDNQPETLAILAKYENSLYKDPAYEKYILSTSAPLVRPTGGQAFGNMKYVPWNRVYESIKNTGLITKNIDPTNFYTTEFIK